VARIGPAAARVVTLVLGPRSTVASSHSSQLTITRFWDQYYSSELNEACDMASGPSGGQRMWNLDVVTEQDRGDAAGDVAIARLVSPLQRRLLVATRGRVSLTGKRPVLLLTTTGRRSGGPGRSRSSSCATATI
jgi:hypothetical protein